MTLATVMCEVGDDESFHTDASGSRIRVPVLTVEYLPFDFKLCQTWIITSQKALKSILRRWEQLTQLSMENLKSLHLFAVGSETARRVNTELVPRLQNLSQISIKGCDYPKKEPGLAALFAECHPPIPAAIYAALEGVTEDILSQLQNQNGCLAVEHIPTYSTRPIISPFPEEVMSLIQKARLTKDRVIFVCRSGKMVRGCWQRLKLSGIAPSEWSSGVEILASPGTAAQTLKQLVQGTANL